MKDCEIVVLSRFREIFRGFQECVDADAPELKKLCVWDCATPPERTQKWSHFVAVNEFNMARNANLGWVATDGDIVYSGDDVRIIEPDTIARLQAIAYSDPAIGILSPKILGHAQELQLRPTSMPLTFAPFVAFVFVYIKREVIDLVGYLDDRFEHYGVEDIDYCYRVRKAEFKIAITPEVTVKHGVNGHLYGSTFIEVRGEEQMAKDDRANWARFAEKWGIENEPHKLMEFVEKG